MGRIRTNFRPWYNDGLKKTLNAIADECDLYEGEASWKIAVEEIYSALDRHEERCKVECQRKGLESL